jgi:4-hydroxy-3-methylbut-2-enyl diphosphate reductase
MRAPLRVVLAQPRSLCAGVVRAIDIVERALQKYGAPIYVRHEIVHNRYVLDELRNKGAIFVEELSDVPNGALVVFSAHGVSRAVQRDAQTRGLDVIDAICPLVQRVHNEAVRYVERGFQVILVGHAGHPEVEGVRGQVPHGLSVVGNEADVAALNIPASAPLAYVTQTTLSAMDTARIIAALKVKYPQIVGPDLRDICYATQNRQSAVIAMARQVDLVLVIGSANSSNSNRLCEVANEAGVQAYLIDGPQDVNAQWLQGVASIGLTAGASAPEVLVQRTIDYLRERFSVSVEALEGIEESVHFRLPVRLMDAAE